MKIIFIILVLLSSLYSDEMQRIESIIQDIAKLRVDYEGCEAKLKDKILFQASTTSTNVKKYEKLYKEERQKNRILKAEIDLKKDLENKNKKLFLKVKELQNKLAFKNDLVKPKKCVEKDNKFPKLMMKKEFQDKNLHVDKKQIQKLENSSNETIKATKARSFRLITDSAIYDAIDGKEIAKWVLRTSFTSNKETQNWVQITGYFVDKQWRSASKEMWIKKDQVSQR